jgi:hypothetical protein
MRRRQDFFDTVQYAAVNDVLCANKFTLPNSFVLKKTVSFNFIALIL